MTVSPSTIWDELDNVLSAPRSPVLAPLPIRNGPSKRSAVNARLDSDSEGDGPDLSTPTPAAPRVNKNIIEIARRVAARKKLRSEQVQEVEDFAADTLSIQNTKLFSEVLAVRNKLDSIVSKPLPFEVSEHLHTNIVSYANGVFFSAKLSAYKGSIPLNHVMDIIKRLRFDLPAGIEHNRADWQKVTKDAQEALTQIRGSVKKELKTSVSEADPKKQTNIFDLTQVIVKGTNVKVTVPLMARIALMRAIYLEHPGDKFWDQVDSRLTFLRSKATTPEQLARAFKHFLVKDREHHGQDSHYYNQVSEHTSDTLQQEIDESIEGATPVVAQQEAPAPEAGPSEQTSTPLAATSEN